MLTSCQLELKAALLEINKQDKIIKKLTNKIKQISQVTRSARSAAREAKHYAKNIQDNSKQAAKRMELEVDKVETKCAQMKCDFEREVEKVRTVEQVSALSINFC